MENYQNYKSWLQGINSTGSQPEFNAESDARVKKFVRGAYSSDSILRKMIGLKFLSDNVIDENLAQLYFLKQIL